MKRELKIATLVLALGLSLTVQAEPDHAGGAAGQERQSAEAPVQPPADQKQYAGLSSIFTQKKGNAADARILLMGKSEPNTRSIKSEDMDALAKWHQGYIDLRAKFAAASCASDPGSVRLIAMLDEAVKQIKWAFDGEKVADEKELTLAVVQIEKIMKKRGELNPNAAAAPYATPPEKSVAEWLDKTLVMLFGTARRGELPSTDKKVTDWNAATDKAISEMKAETACKWAPPAGGTPGGGTPGGTPGGATPPGKAGPVDPNKLVIEDDGSKETISKLQSQLEALARSAADDGEDSSLRLAELQLQGQIAAEQAAAQAQIAQALGNNQTPVVTPPAPAAPVIPPTIPPVPSIQAGGQNQDPYANMPPPPAMPPYPMMPPTPPPAGPPPAPVVLAPKQPEDRPLPPRQSQPPVNIFGQGANGLAMGMPYGPMGGMGVYNPYMQNGGMNVQNGNWLQGRLSGLNINRGTGTSLSSSVRATNTNLRSGLAVSGGRSKIGPNLLGGLGNS